MKAILLLVTLLAAMPLPGAPLENLPRLTVGTGIGSEVFSNVTVTSVTATHIFFSHSSGLGSAKLKDLEPEMQERFHFNPANARIAEARQAQANALYLRELARRPAAHRPVSPVSSSDDDSGPTTVPACEVSPNPPPLAMHTGLSLKNFADHPLFAKDGPSQNDVFQGGDGDCYFLSRLAALAGANPDFIRRTVTDLKDGTYVVRLEVFVRVPPARRTRSARAIAGGHRLPGMTLRVASRRPSRPGKAAAHFRERGQTSRGESP